nr:7182_t:CDS:2 [Entrophospora candida]
MEEGNFLTQCWNSKGMHSLPFFCFYEEKDANGERIEEELGYYARNNHLSGLATCRAGNGNQAQGEDVKQFWKDVELKKIESENKLLGVKIKQAELQFSVDRTLVGNEAYIILDQKKLDYALNSNSALKNIRKHLADGEGMENIRSYKCRRENEVELQTPEHQIYSLIVMIHNQSLQMITITNENEFGVKGKNIFEQRFDALENSKKWKLKSGKFVEDVLYKLGIQCRYHNLVHSFIIDIEDTFIKDEFTGKRISEIVEKKERTK